MIRRTAGMPLRDGQAPFGRRRGGSVPGMARFRLVPERSSLAIDARSNVGPIRWEATGLQGRFEVVESEAVDPRQVNWAELEVSVDSLTSGNPLYDAELLRRID